MLSIVLRGYFKISFSKSIYVQVTLFKNFETCIVTPLKQALYPNKKRDYSKILFAIISKYACNSSSQIISIEAI
jgi:hypothetical protein